MGWTGWLGPNRNAYSATLPKKLPETPHIIWRRKLGVAGLGGIAADAKYVVMGDRDLDNLFDVFRCFRASDGQPLWTVQYPTIGKLDYGNSPRATPLIDGEFVYLMGAFGDLHCVKIASGEIVWRQNIRLNFGANDQLIWGTCSSPLLVDGKLIVNPGAKDASVVALDAKTGATIWKTPGDRSAFGSFIVGTFGGRTQIIGHDKNALRGWDLKSGEVLWKVVPEYDGDFNVPTPVVVGERLLITTEGNGTRLFEFTADGAIKKEPVSVFDDLAPDMSTPVVLGDRAFCLWRDLFAFDTRGGKLKLLWNGVDDTFGEYAALIVGNERVLVIGNGGELVLVDANADEFEVVSRLKVFEDASTEVLSHPAVVGDRIYVRGEHELVCVRLN